MISLELSHKHVESIAITTTSKRYDRKAIKQGKREKRKDKETEKQNEEES